MKKVRVLSACDRNNYGDLLFPMIVFKVFEKQKHTPYSEIINYGIRRSDLGYFGALKTRSITDLKNDTKENDLIIVAGGEVLGGGWMNILRFFSPFWNKIYHNRLLRGVINRLQLLDTWKYLTVGSSKPFVLDGEVFDNAKVCYSSVGALGINRLLEKKRYKNYFSKISLLSVRDKVSYKKASSQNIDCIIVPDSAILMSDLLVNEIEANLSKECLEIADEKYIFLQFGLDKGPDNEEAFVTRLTKFSKKNECKVLLCPIGLAMDHDDEIILKRIKSREPNFKYYKPKNLYETMYLVKQSSLYLGTSLHGFITAQSFTRPFFVFDQKVNKNEQYIDTWNVAKTPTYGDYFDFDLIQKRIDLFDEAFEREKTNAQKRLVYENLENILHGKV